MDYDVIFMTGAQGSGKGTQGKELAAKTGFFFWDMGAVLREIAAKDTPLGKSVADLINRGIFLPDEMLIEVAKDRLESIPDGQGVIFDGIPRRRGQADFLLDYLKAHGRSRMVTILVDLPREESLRRLLKRAEIEKRVDDTPEAIGARLKFHDETIVPTIDYLATQTKFVKINGNQSVEGVARDINAALGIA